MTDVTKNSSSYDDDDGRVDRREKSIMNKNVDRRSATVDLDELLNFIFPTSLQHPLSTGRLYAFAMYGPLDENAYLRAGHNGQRVVSAWEIDTMCLHFEREDILKVYISSERPLFVLSEAQKEEVIAQADSHLKTAKGRGYRRQVTREEVIQLLSSLPRDPDSGLVSFHDAQKLIVDYRDKQIARFKVIFPDIIAGSATGRGRAPGNKAGNQGLVEVPFSSRREEGISGRKGPRGRAKFSTDVAPAEMFVKDAGFTPAGMANRTNKLLNTRAYKVGNIADGNDPGLTQNVRLIREDGPLSPGRGAWDPYACLRGYNIGGHVKSANSTTTVKRRA